MTVRRIALGTLAGIVILAGLAGFGVWYRGGSEPSNAYVYADTWEPVSNPPRVYYRGIECKTAGTPIVLLKRYYAFVITRDTGVTCTYSYNGEGYNDFRCFYETGTIAARGVCMVKKNPDQILPDETDVKEAQFYNPKGEMVSSIQSRTGVETWSCANGQKNWELVLRDGVRQRLSAWYCNGQLQKQRVYVDGVRDGAFVSYYPDGGKETEGSYYQGERSGRWVRYNEDGGIKRVERYPASVWGASRLGKPSEAELPDDPAVSAFLGDWSSEEDSAASFRIFKRSDGTAIIQVPANDTWWHVFENIRFENGKLLFDEYSYTPPSDDYKSIVTPFGEHPFSGVPCETIMELDKDNPDVIMVTVKSTHVPEGIKGTLQRIKQAD